MSNPKLEFTVDHTIFAIKSALITALQDISGGNLATNNSDLTAIHLEYPANIEHGDFSSNCALAYSKKLGLAPKVLAEKIIAHTACAKLVSEHGIHSTSAGPGFINFTIPQSILTNAITEILDKGSSGDFGKRSLKYDQKILIDYTNPNPFKVFHIGHLMANALGESISRLLEYSGAKIIRANYQGDVGLHVAKAVWGMMQKKAGMPERTASLKDISDFISSAYVYGSEQEEQNPHAKAEIQALNKKIFDRSDSEINELYDWGRKVTLEAFEEIYKLVGTRFDQYYFESETSGPGLELVRKHIPQVFEESEGAIIFPGEKYGLHTRVFITSLGLPSYEAKEIGLTYAKFKDYNPDISIVVTANEQSDYFKVVQKALSLMKPEYADRMRHVSHGMMRFASGKMSSRKGNVITGESLLADARAMVYEKVAERELSDTEKKVVADIVGVGAIKFSILKQATGSDIIFNPEQAVSFEGDSGPYLQYSCVRAQAVLRKATQAGISPSVNNVQYGAHATLEKLLLRFPTIIDRAREELEPHHIATYLLDLSGAFNAFYAQGAIVSDQVDSPYKVALTQAFVFVMQSGLYVLGIRIPEKM